MTDEQITVKLGADGTALAAGMAEGEGTVESFSDAVESSMSAAAERTVEYSKQSVAAMEAASAGVHEHEGVVVRGLASITESFEGLRARIGVFGEAATAVSEFVFVGLGLEKVAEVFGEVTEKAEKLEHLSQVTGIASGTLSELAGAARLMGLNSDEASRGWVKLAQSIAEAEDPTSKQAAALHALGLSAEDLKGKGLDQQARMIADAMKGFADDGNKAAIVAELFGRNVEFWLPFLDGGAQKLDELTRKAKELGLAFDDTSNKELVDFRENLNLMEGAIAGTVNKVVSGIAHLRAEFNKGPKLQISPITGLPIADQNPSPPAAPEGDNADKPHLQTLPAAGGDASGKSADQMKGFEAALTAMLAAKQAYGDKAKEIELQYWQNILQTQTVSAEQYGTVQKKVYDLQNQLHEKAAQEAKTSSAKQTQAELGEFKQQEDAAGKNYAQRLAIAEAFEAKLIEEGKRETPEYQRVADEIIQIQRAMEQQRIEVAMQGIQQRQEAANKEVDAQEKIAKLQLQAGEISQKQLTQNELTYAAQRLAIDEQALNEQIRLAEQANDPAKLQSLKNQLLAVEQQYQNNVLVIQKQAEVQQEAIVKKFGDTVSNDLSRAFNQMLSSHKSFTNILKGLWNDLAASAIQQITKIVVQHTLGEALKTAATQEGELERLAVKSVASVESLAISAAEGIKEIAISAYKAAAGAYAAIAAIPYVGPFLAPAAAAAAGAAVFEIGSNIASAAGGYDIPSGINPMTQLHAREMVLPAALADTVRSAMTGEGPSGGGGRRGGDVHLHVHATDAQSVQRLFENNGGVLAAVMRKQMRGFAKS